MPERALPIYNMKAVLGQADCLVFAAGTDLRHWLVQGGLSVNYSDNYYHLSQRHADVPRLTQQHYEAMALFNEIASSDALRMDHMLQPGDVQLLNNHTQLHTRAKFEDFPVSFCLCWTHQLFWGACFRYAVWALCCITALLLPAIFFLVLPEQIVVQTECLREHAAIISFSMLKSLRVFAGLQWAQASVAVVDSAPCGATVARCIPGDLWW